MRFLVDMNLPPAWCTVLRGVGHDAVHWSEVGAMSAPDEEILGWAAERGYVVFTHDLDFSTMLAASRQSRPSVMQMRVNDVLPEAQSGTVLTAVAQFQRELEAGALVTIEPARARVRVLPLK